MRANKKDRKRKCTTIPWDTERTPHLTLRAVSCKNSISSVVVNRIKTLLIRWIFSREIEKKGAPNTGGRSGSTWAIQMQGCVGRQVTAGVKKPAAPIRTPSTICQPTPASHVPPPHDPPSRFKYGELPNLKYEKFESRSRETNRGRGREEGGLVSRREKGKEGNSRIPEPILPAASPSPSPGLPFVPSCSARPPRPPLNLLSSPDFPRSPRDSFISLPGGNGGARGETKASFRFFFLSRFLFPADEFFPLPTILSSLLRARGAKISHPPCT